MTTILLTGANGQLGCEIRAWHAVRAAGAQKTRLIATDVAELDITDPAAVAVLVKAEKVDVIVNCAAYTAVDKAESEPDMARRINAEGPAVLARAAKEAGAALIHISTDYVFDGRGTQPYRTDDPTGPQGVYGLTKLEGEQAIRTSGCRGVIVRTSWLYSSYGNNFVKTMMRLGREKGEVRVVDDQWGSPTYAGDLAEFIMEAVIPSLQSTQRHGAVYHYANQGCASWFMFAAQIMETAAIECKVIPVPSSEYPTPARRPHYSILDTQKTIADFGVTIPEWEESLEKGINILLTQ